MNDIDALIDRATEGSNAAAALMAAGNTDCIPVHLAMLADSTLAIAMLLRHQADNLKPVKAAKP